MVGGWKNRERGGEREKEKERVKDSFAEKFRKREGGVVEAGTSTQTTQNGVVTIIYCLSKGNYALQRNDKSLVCVSGQ